MINNKVIGKKIKKLRQDQSMTQRELAAEVGISISYLSKIEGGNYPRPRAKTLSRIAYALNVNTNELLR